MTPTVAQLGDLETLADVVSNDPIAAVLLAVGALLVAVALAVFGFLSLGGLVAGLTRGA